MSAFRAGDLVRIVSGSLGTITLDDPRHFTAHVLEAGDDCEVVSYAGQLPDGWLLVSPIAQPDVPRMLYAPVHPSMIERVQS